MVVGWYGMIMWNDVNGFTVYSSQSNDNVAPLPPSPQVDANGSSIKRGKNAGPYVLPYYTHPFSNVVLLMLAVNTICNRPKNVVVE